MNTRWLVLGLAACGGAPVTPAAAPIGHASGHASIERQLAACPAHSWDKPPLLDEPGFGEVCHDLAGCDRLCTSGTAVACVDAGNQLARARTDYPRQLRLFARACELGNVLGCTNLGATVRVDVPEWRANVPCANALFETACAADEPNGCTMLGNAYATGDGAARDPQRALAAFKAGCLTTPPPFDAEQRDGVSFACETFLAAAARGDLGTVAPDVLAIARGRCQLAGACN